MEVRAQIIGLRLAPRKVRAVADLLKKRTVNDALDQLAHMVRRSSPHLVKLINAAIANAEHSHHMVRENLFIKSLVVDEGRKLKRYMPRAQGRATEIQRKTSHVRLTLDEKVPGLKRAPKAAEEEAAKKRATAAQDEAKVKAAEKAAEKAAKAGETKQGAERKGFVKRMFTRKSV